MFAYPRCNFVYLCIFVCAIFVTLYFCVYLCVLSLQFCIFVYICVRTIYILCNFVFLCIFVCTIFAVCIFCVYLCTYILCDSNNFSKSHRPALCVFSPSHLFALSILIISINILYLFALSSLITFIFVYNSLASLFSSLLYFVSFSNCNCVICYIFPFNKKLQIQPKNH